MQFPITITNFSEVFRNGSLPVLVYSGSISDLPDWNFPNHSHDDLCEVIYVAGGEGDFTIAGRPYHVGPNNLLIYNKGVIHEESSVPSRPLKSYFCGIANLHLANLPDGFLIPSRIVPVISVNEHSLEIQNIMSTILQESFEKNFGYELICNSLLISLIISIIRIISDNYHLATSVETSFAFHIKKYIDSHYRSNMSLNDIANLFHVSPYYVSHIFKEGIGCSVINYLINSRIGEAKRLLLTSDLSIQEVGESVGYINSNYFSTLFKKSTGVSPKEFRQTNLRY